MRIRQKNNKHLLLIHKNCSWGKWVQACATCASLFVHIRRLVPVSHSSRLQCVSTHSKHNVSWPFSFYVCIPLQVCERGMCETSFDLIFCLTVARNSRFLQECFNRSIFHNWCSYFLITIQSSVPDCSSRELTNIFGSKRNTRENPRRRRAIVRKTLFGKMIIGSYCLCWLIKLSLLPVQCCGFCFLDLFVQK
jgi:hypothetical protein